MADKKAIYTGIGAVLGTYAFDLLGGILGGGAGYYLGKNSEETYSNESRRTQLYNPSGNDEQQRKTDAEYMDHFNLS